jgi:hypothetical protein
MLITRTSLLTGNTNTFEIPVKEYQLDLWNKGMLIQDAMPQLSPEAREFIMSGITPQEWDDNGFHPRDPEDYVSFKKPIEKLS